jgi:hypothetical protein
VLSNVRGSGASSLGGLAPRATRLKIGVIVLADANSPLAQLDYADLTSPNDASAGGFADVIERTPILERENALGLSLSGFANGHGHLNSTRLHAAAPDRRDFSRRSDTVSVRSLYCKSAKADLIIRERPRLSTGFLGPSPPADRIETTVRCTRPMAGLALFSSLI